MNPLSLRVVARYKGAFEHPSEGARKQYLKDHPKADPKNHTVKEHSEKAAPDEPEHQDKGKKNDEAPKTKTKSKGDFFKGLSERAKAFVTKSNAAVQKFVSDEGHRAKVMSDAGKTILASPKTYAKRLVHTAKEEVHEFKEAGGALKSLASGKKLDHHQKKALKTVAIHMSIAVAAAALTSTGVLAGAAALGKGMVQKIALKAAAQALEKAHLVQELGHIGHGAHEVFEGLHHVLASDEGEEDEEKRKVEKVDPEEAFAILVMQSVIQAMKDLNDDDLAEILEEASGEQEKQAFKKGAAVEGDLPQLLLDGESYFEQLDAWIAEFGSVLLAARAEAEGVLEKRVWQTRFVSYFKQGGVLLDAVRDLDQTLDDLFVESPAKAQIVHNARVALRIPPAAEITRAISDIDFYPDPATGRDGITYNIDVLRNWATALDTWVRRGYQAMHGLLAKARRFTKSV